MLQYLHRSINYFHRKNSQIFKWTHRRMYSFPNFSIRNWLCKTILKNGLSLRESRERNDIQRGKEFRCCVVDDPLADVLLKKDIIDSPIRMIQLIHLNESQERETELWNILIWRRFSCSPSLRLEEPRSLHLPQRTPQLVKWTKEGLRLID